jgi:hypothetical protein
MAPRSHEAVPLLLPQPKVNCGVALAGVACSRTIASGTFPPFVQALTTHWSAIPRLLLAWELVTWTQRLTFAEPLTDRPPVPAAAVDVAEGEALAVGEAVAEREGVADSVRVAEREAVAEADGECEADAWAVVLLVVLGDFDGVGSGVALLVAAGEVGAWVCLTLPPPLRPNVDPGLTLVFGLADALGDVDVFVLAVVFGVAVGDGDFDVFGVAVAVGDGDFDGEAVDVGVGVGVGVGPGVEVDTLSGWQDTVLVPAAASSTATA